MKNNRTIHEEIISNILDAIDLNAKNFKTIGKFRNEYLDEGPACLDISKVLNDYKITRKPRK